MASFLDYSPVLTLGRSMRRRLEDDARMLGRDNLPASAEKDINEAQHSIVDHFARENDKLNESFVAYLSRHFTAIHADLTSQPAQIDSLLADATLDIQKHKTGAVGQLRPLCLAEHRAHRALKAFRQKHRLDHDARYPSSTILHYAIVMVIVLVESLANTYFFAQGNPMGYLGGLLQSFLVSATNVGTAVFMGALALRQLNHIKPFQRVLGAAGVAALAIFMPCFNLLTAHYRDLLASDPATALERTLPATLADPFGLSFDSLMLLVIGVLAASLGLYKGYTADDRYPGYGRQTREHVAARNAYEGKIKEILAGLVGVIERIRSVSAEEMRASAGRIESAAGSINDLRSSFERYDNTRAAIVDQCTRFLKRYRETNQEIRDERPPRYFSEFPAFAESPAIEEARRMRIKGAEQLLDQARNEHGHLVKSIAQLQGTLAERVEEVAKSLDETLEQLARAAVSELGEEPGSPAS